MIADFLGGLMGGGGGGASAGGGGGDFSGLGSLLLLEGVKQGFGVLEGERQEDISEKAIERRGEIDLELSDRREEARLERLEKELESQLQLTRLKQLAANARSTQGNRSKMASTLLNAAVQGGSAESQALTRAGQLAQNIR